MARFLFIWMIMLGAMVGVREGTHFEVDVWPELTPRAQRAAAHRLAAVRAGVRAGVRLVRHRVHRSSRWNRISELADLPLWLIHRRLAAHRLHLAACSSASSFVDDCARARRRGARHDRRGRVCRRAMAALILFGVFFALMFLRVPVAFALGLACLPILFIEPRLSPMTLVQETFNAYNSFILLAVPFFLLTANLMNVGGITDRLVRAVAHDGRALPRRAGADQRACCRSSSPASPARRPPTRRASARSSSRRRSRKATTCRFSIAITAVSAVLAVIIPPSILMIVWGGVLTVSIGALYPRRHHPGPADRPRADGHRARLRQDARLPDLSARDAAGSSCARRWSSIPALMTPFIIIGGKLFGWFTATESACIAVLYAGVLSLVRLPRDGPASSCTSALLDTGKLPAIALFCVGTASRVRLAARLLPDPEGAARRACRPGAWASIGDRLLHRRSCSWSSAASSTRSRRSSSSARSSSRWRKSVRHGPGAFRHHRHRRRSPSAWSRRPTACA